MSYVAFDGLAVAKLGDASTLDDAKKIVKDRTIGGTGYFYGAAVYTQADAQAVMDNPNMYPRPKNLLYS